MNVNLVFEWFDLHRDELLDNWRRIGNRYEYGNKRNIMLWVTKAEYADEYKLYFYAKIIYFQKNFMDSKKCFIFACVFWYH